MYILAGGEGVHNDSTGSYQALLHDITSDKLNIYNSSTEIGMMMVWHWPFNYEGLYMINKQ